MLLSRDYYDSPQNDIWAVGCIALQLQWNQDLSNSHLHPFNRSIDEMGKSASTLRKVRQLMDSVGCSQGDRKEQEVRKEQDDRKEQEVRKEQQRGMSVLGLDFVSICLSLHIERRASIGQLLNHPFISQ